MPNVAPQIRVAFSEHCFEYRIKSPGERLMTFSTSAVAVCCSSDSLDRRYAGAIR